MYRTDYRTISPNTGLNNRRPTESIRIALGYNHLCLDYASATNGSLFSFSASKSAFLGSSRDVMYVNISIVQLTHSIVVPIIYSLARNESVNPVSP